MVLFIYYYILLSPQEKLSATFGSIVFRYDIKYIMCLGCEIVAHRCCDIFDDDDDLESTSSVYIFYYARFSI